MLHKQECLMVLDLLDEGKITVVEAERLIHAMQPQRRRFRPQVQFPNAISSMVDGTQANLGEVMQKLSTAIEEAVPTEVN